MIPMSFNDIIKTEELIIILVIVIMSLVGSLSKDYMNLILKGIRMKMGRIILSTICSSVITYTFSIYILDKLYFRGLVGVSYFIGLLGFELISKFSNLSDVFKMYLLARFGLDPDKLQKIDESLEKLESKLEDFDNNEKDDNKKQNNKNKRKNIK